MDRSKPRKLFYTQSIAIGSSGPNYRALTFRPKKYRKAIIPFYQMEKAESFFEGVA